MKPRPGPDALSRIRRGAACFAFVLAAAGALTMVASHLVPQGGQWCFALGTGFLIAAAVPWLVALALARRLRHGARLAFTTALVGALGFLPVWRNPVEQLGFAVARPALEQFASTGECPQNAGYAGVLYCEIIGHVPLVVVAETEQSTSTAYAFIPAEQPSGAGTPGADGAGAWRLVDAQRIVPMRPVGGGWWVVSLRS